MHVRRLFVRDTRSPIRLSEDEQHYATRVLRLKPGQLVELITPSGCVSARIESVHPDLELTVVSDPEIRNEPVLPITLYQGLPDHLDKLELIVQKAVELGVGRVVPFYSRHTSAKYRNMKLDRKLNRIRKIAKEAVRQCRRSVVPEIEDPVQLTGIELGTPPTETRFVFYERPMDAPRELFAPPKAVGIFVGPEGGFAEHEIQFLLENGCIPVHLPGRTLRTETAALACLTLIQARFGDFRSVP